MLSILAGFDSTMSYYLSMARIFSFLPYFVLGYYWNEWNYYVEEIIKKWKKQYIFAINILIIMVGFLLIKTEKIKAIMLYGYSYQIGNYNMGIKILLLFIGVNWILFFKNIFPRNKIWGISTIGKNTLSIYLIHGFIVRFVGHTERVFVYSKYINLCMALFFTISILIAFGNRYFAMLFRLLCTNEWLIKITKFCQRSKREQ